VKAGVFVNIRTPESNILNHLVLSPLSLHPERIPKRARTPTEEIPLVPRIKTIPIAQDAFAISQFCLPLIPPVDTQPARDDHADDCNESEVGL
jgi:hypothetical protein